MSVVLNVAALLITILAFVALLNGLLSWVGDTLYIEGLSFQFLIGKLCVPLAWLMGVEPKVAFDARIPRQRCHCSCLQDIDLIGEILGLNSFVHAFDAYGRLLRSRSVLSPRSVVIATYALCGYSHPAAIGVNIAVLGTLAPERRGDVARAAIRAFVAGSMACFMTACVAGTLLD